VANNKTSNNCSSERRKKELGTKMSRMFRVKTDRHLQMIGSKLNERKLLRQCKEKQNSII
jgi:hypothetical protein